MQQQIANVEWSPNNFYDVAGCQVGVKAKASSGKKKLTDHQKWHVSLNASLHLGSPARLKPKLKAEISTSF